MTCIAAAIDRDGAIVMGGDSVSLQSDCVRIDRRSKVFRLGPFLFGTCGSHRLAQICEYTLEAPPITDRDWTAYMVRNLVPAMRKHLEDQGGEVKRDEQRRMDGSCLIGIDGLLFEVDTTYAVISPRAPFYAIGCASQEAMAAMYTARELVEGISARRIVECGLKAAAEFDINIRPPFSILSLEGVIQ